MTDSLQKFTIELLQLLQSRWHPRATQRQLRTVVRFKLNINGTVKSADLQKSSGDIGHDLAALELVKSDLVFPPLPAGINESTLFAFNFDSDSDDPDLQGAGVPRKPLKPQRASAAQLNEPD